jgi:hypothetical protein
MPAGYAPLTRRLSFSTPDYTLIPTSRRKARPEADSLRIRHDTIIEVLLEPMDTSPTLDI